MTEKNCPKCGNEDQVLTLAEIYEENEQSKLAKKLAPPEIEGSENPPAFGSQQGLGCITAIFFGSFFFISVAKSSKIGSVIFGFFTLIFVVFFLLTLRKGLANRREIVKKENLWVAKMQVWENLSYCKKDNLLFDPDSGEVIPIEELQHFIQNKTEISKI